jgi:small conductance mechanosensitive channel
MNNLLQPLDQVRASALDMAVRFGPKLVAALIIIAAGYMIGRWVGRILDHLLLRLNLEVPIRSLLVRFERVLVLGLFAIMVFQNLGVELSPLIAGLGVAGAGVALAVQGILGNVAAGLTIIFTRPFHMGDNTPIVEAEGEIVDISLFSKTLKHTDQSNVASPNRKSVGKIIHNDGQIRQLTSNVGVSFGTDVGLALSLIGGVLRASFRVFKAPAPVFGVARLSGSGVTLAVSPWVTVPDYVPAGSELNQAILETFRARGIVIPLPQRKVRMLGVSA